MAALLSGARRLISRLSGTDNSDLKRQGNALLAEGKLAQAMACYQQAATLRPDDAQAHLNLGYVQLEQARHAEALQSLARAAALDGTLADAPYLMGRAHHEQGHLGEAAAYFAEAARLNPALVHAWRDLAQVLQALGRLEEALQSCDRALQLAPGDLSALHGRAAILVGLRRFDAALESLDQALARAAQAGSAERAALLQARGITLAGLWRYDEALASAQAAAQADPADPDNWRALASALQAMGRHGDALAVYTQAVAQHPQHAQLRWDESLCRLLMGEMQQGWRSHEWRLRTPMYSAVDATTRSAAPRWNGETPIDGQRLLLHAEQGLGDAIQFARYVPAVLDRGAHVVLQVAPALVGLMRSLIVPEAVRMRLHVVGPDEPVPEHDLRCSLLSLPAVFGTDLDSVPASVPYFAVAPELGTAWRERLDAIGGADLPRVGLVWSGNPRHHNDHNRSLSLARLLHALPGDMKLVGLQPEMKDADRRTLQESGRVHDLGGSLRDFMDTAAVIAGLDLVISVDTSVAHLAGALGRPLWLLLPLHPDWRWMLGRADSPWYPSCRLWRQQAPGNWDGTLSALQQALLQWRAQEPTEAQIAGESHAQAGTTVPTSI